jgi:hypothetical protein
MDVRAKAADLRRRKAELQARLEREEAEDRARAAASASGSGDKAATVEEYVRLQSEKVSRAFLL